MSSKAYSVKPVLFPTFGLFPNTGAARNQPRLEDQLESEKPFTILNQKPDPYIEPGIQPRSRLGRGGHPFRPLLSRLFFPPSSAL